MDRTERGITGKPIPFKPYKTPASQKRRKKFEDERRKEEIKRRERTPYSGHQIVRQTGPTNRQQALNWYSEEKELITFQQFLAKIENIG